MYVGTERRHREVSQRTGGVSTTKVRPAYTRRALISSPILTSLFVRKKITMSFAGRRRGNKVKKGVQFTVMVVGQFFFSRSRTRCQR